MEFYTKLFSREPEWDIGFEVWVEINKVESERNDRKNGMSH